MPNEFIIYPAEAPEGNDPGSAEGSLAPKIERECLPDEVLPVFESDQGFSASLPHTLNTYGGENTITQDQTVHVRFVPLVGNLNLDPVVASLADTAEGQVRVDLPEEVYQRPDIYRVQFARIKEGAPVAHMSESLLQVKPTSFGTSPAAGPPTVYSIRQRLFDLSPDDNELLDEVEFRTDQVMEAMAWPIHTFNDQLPRDGGTYISANFPWTNKWADATVGRLLWTAANNFRRNQLNVQGGSIAINDKNREKEYLKEAKELMLSFQSWVGQEKYAKSALNAYGGVYSQYVRGSTI